ncbi:AAA ATPase [Desulfovibrio sp. DV]|uniref:XrtA/PEP-CTERM system-associated ATPase n=1 Tax=Desulfovibrio sp. DV TaxID=1844708 RepID=UPI00094BA56C|nr:XrtA/PEP-CTERM system-associated ATPase [Desulfovibrio sp. DV]OLN29427.1 AAA ATPase [Desulfovibrio sp. DV]
MYRKYFNFSRKPFELLPNPDFLYLSQSHKKALTYLHYGIRERLGFILLTGQVGTGKTTIVRELIDKYMQGALLAHIFHTRMENRQLLAMINEELGMTSDKKNKPALLRELHDFLIDQYSRRKPVVLIIDEAQNLSPSILEDIRMLSNLETKDDKLLHIILVGQPELRQTLAAPELLQLRQRIQINCKIEPLANDETKNYILHRLESAGNREALDFSEDCFPAIHSYTKGIPRLINILCDFILLDAYANEVKSVSHEAIHEIANDISFNAQYWETSQLTAIHNIGNIDSNTPQDPTNKLHGILINFNKRLRHIESGTPEKRQGVDDELRATIQTMNNRLEQLGQVVSSLDMQVKALAIPMLQPSAAAKPDTSGRSWFRRQFFGKS